MDTDRLTRLIIGTLVLLGLGLGLWVNAWCFALTGLVGLGILQSAFTGKCPLGGLIGKLSGCCKSDSSCTIGKPKE